MALQQIHDMIQYLTGSLRKWKPFGPHPFSRFPDELLCMIAAECDDRETILALRLCGSGALSQGAAEALFSTIRKQPSQEAVQDLIALGNSNYSRHVKTLSLRSGTRWRNVDPSAYQVNDENLLAKAVLKFQNLEALELRTDEWLTKTMEQAGARNFMKTLTTAAATSTSRVPKKRLLIKARGNATLDYGAHSRPCFHLEADADLTTRFSEISLDASNFCSCYEKRPVLLSNFFYDRLEKLEVHAPEDSNTWFLLSDGHSTSRPHSHSLPALRKLKLSNIVCSFEGILHFIGRSNGTLRELTLDTIDLRSIRPQDREWKGLSFLLNALRKEHKLSRFHYRNIMYLEDRDHDYECLVHSVMLVPPTKRFQKYMGYQLSWLNRKVHDDKLLLTHSEKDRDALGRLLLAVQDQGQELVDDREKYYARRSRERDAKELSLYGPSGPPVTSKTPKRRTRELQTQDQRRRLKQFINEDDPWA